jgi:disulfide bond formation protein DsbB
MWNFKQEDQQKVIQVNQALMSDSRPLWLPSRRLTNLLGFAACTLAMGTAYGYFERYLQLEPCPLCWFQRGAMVLLAAVFLLAAVHNPGRWGARVYGLLIALAAGLGAYIAGRHVWVQSLPPDQVPACAPDLDYMLEVFTLGETIRKVLAEAGDCAEVQWAFLGLSIPGWTLVAFLVLGSIGFVRNWMRA